MQWHSVKLKQFADAVRKGFPSFCITAPCLRRISTFICRGQRNERWIPPVDEKSSAPILYCMEFGRCNVYITFIVYTRFFRYLISSPFIHRYYNLCIIPAVCSMLYLKTICLCATFGNRQEKWCSRQLFSLLERWVQRRYLRISI